MIFRVRLNSWKRACLFLVLFVTSITFSIGCSLQTKNITSPPIGNIAKTLDLSMFGPALPANLFINNKKPSEDLIDLGRELYYEKRLSKSQTISCNSCHNLSNYGVDNEATSPGHKGQRGDRNSPTVYNAAGHIAQFWDGRAATLEEQALGPILNSVEMAMPSNKKVLEVVNSMPEYVTAFKKAFPEDSNPVTYDNIGKAIGTFERGLVTPAPFDKYFAGDKSALTTQQVRGLKLFEQSCATCHAGTYFGGDMYQKLGKEKPWPDLNDLGRYKVTRDKSDRMVFKVPSLRNIAKTGPYYHDGGVKTLDEAVKLMAKHQTTKELSDGEVKDIVAFLDSLTGELPAEYIEEPSLPKSTSKTPKPDVSTPH